MSFFTFTRTAAPATPALNKSTVYIDTADRRAKTIDDNGVISTLVNDGLQDRNNITNAGFMIQQRVATAATAIPAVSTTTRAGQVSDRWAVTAGNVTTCQWTQTDTSATPEVGLESRFYGRITQITNAAKFILSQVLVNSEMAHLRGKKVRVSIKLKQFVGSNQVYKLGLVQLAALGTADTMPAFTSAIGADGIAPTWGANLAAITPDASPTAETGTINGAYVDCTSATTWTRYSAVFTVPTDAKNLVFVLWKNGVGLATDSVGVAEAQITQGAEIVDYIQVPHAEELVRCQRFFAKSFPLTVVPAAAVAVATGGNGETGIIARAAATALAATIRIIFPVRMWRTPTLTLFTPVGAGAVPFRINGTTPAVQTVAATTGLLDMGAVVTATGDAAGVVGDLVGVHYTAEAEFIT